MVEDVAELRLAGKRSLWSRMMSGSARIFYWVVHDTCLAFLTQSLACQRQCHLAIVLPRRQLHFPLLLFDHHVEAKAPSPFYLERVLSEGLRGTVAS